MLQITYSKGIYTLTDGVKTYTFNINNGHCVNTKTNKRVTKPSFSKTEILNALYSIFRENNWNEYTNMLTTLYSMLRRYTIMEIFGLHHPTMITLLTMLDKLFNVMPKGGYYFSFYQSEITSLSNKDFVKVINFVREYNNTNDRCINLSAIVRRIETEKFAIAYGNLPLEFVTKYKSTLEQFDKLGKKYRDIAIYYFYHQKLYALRTETTKTYGGHYGVNYICTYIQCCKIMNKQPVKTNNFMREYIETLMAYDIWCETDKNKRFLSHYERYKNNLTFSYGNYTIVLPTNTQDLVTEGNEMHHCVGSYVDRVANGNTLIVFVRHKDTPNKCYITAEINPSNGKISQYFLAYDRNIKTLEDLEFKQALQVWLLSCKW